VIQIRDVPDDVHEAITRAAEEQGLSLTAYLNAELARLARRPIVVAHNAEVIRRAKRRVQGRVDRASIQSALREVRGQG
jgi:hypothetical protein